MIACFAIRCATWEVFMYCQKIASKLPDDGAPIVSLFLRQIYYFYWRHNFVLCQTDSSGLV